MLDFSWQIMILLYGFIDLIGKEDENFMHLIFLLNFSFHTNRADELLILKINSNIKIIHVILKNSYL